MLDMTCSICPHVLYIHGYVIGMAKNQVSCECCQEALVAENAERHKFVVFKSQGGLQQPFPECCCYLFRHFHLTREHHEVLMKR